MSRSELKDQSKECLNGKYGECIKINLLFFGITLIVYLIFYGLALVGNVEDENVILSIGELISSIVSCLFVFGNLSFYLKLSRGEEVTYHELFKKTNLFIPYIIISFLVGLFTILWGILFIIPGIIAAIGYSMVYFIYLDNPDIKYCDLLRNSKQMMIGHRLEYVVLMLSFIGWIILSVLTFGILLLWLIPYMSVVQCKFYDYIKNEK